MKPVSKYRVRNAATYVAERLEQRMLLTTYTPNTTTDFAFSSVNNINGVISGGPGNGQITLRSAIVAANNNAGADSVFVAAGTYTLAVTGIEDTFTANPNANDLDI